MARTHAHNHGDEHRHGHLQVLQSHARAFAIGVVLNLGFVIAEVVFGLAAHSLALLSDAGHNMSDVVGLLLAWGASHISKSIPTKRRTYGWRRSSILAALVNAVVLLVVVGGITWEAILRIGHPEPVAGTTIMWVAAAGVVINTTSALLFLAGREHDLNVKGAFLHMAGDAAVSLGVVGAGLAIRFTGWQWLDPIVSILIGVVITAGTWGLLRESVNLSMDAVPEWINPLEVEEFLARLPAVTAVHDLHIWAMSTTEIALTVHLVMNPAPMDDVFLHGLSHELHEKFGICHTTTQVEHGTMDIPCHQAPASVV
jgi:cobalt-zinc-cadmium efflux system protein